MKSSKKQKERFQPLSANVKVIGIGGGGGNAVARMARNFIRGVDFIAINTDHQDLDHCDVKHRLYIGKSLTKGLGTGMNPDLGRQAAEENRSEIGEPIGWLWTVVQTGLPLRTMWTNVFNDLIWLPFFVAYFVWYRRNAQ